MGNAVSDIITYDGTRFMTEADVDQEFVDIWVALDTTETPNASRGYLVASIKDEDMYSRSRLADYIDDYAEQNPGRSYILICGSENRGDYFHVAILN